MPVPFSIRLDEGLKERLDREAKLEDRSTSYLAHKAIEAFVDAREYRRELIRASHEDALVGKEFISGEAMTAWVESWGGESEMPPPVADVFRR